MIRNYICPTSDGRLAMENVIRAFWQSRAGLKSPPVLVDLQALAKAVRGAR